MNFLLPFFLTLTALISPEVPPEPLDSITSKATVDTFFLSEEQEGAFQEDVNSLFESSGSEIDTFAWNNARINSGRFDYTVMADTVRVPLVDAALSRNFIFPAEGYITSNFGLRHWMWHYGVDVKVYKGDSIRCALDGIVRVIQNDRYGFGKVVVVRHHNGLETLYGHLSKTLVTANQKLSAGEIVGLGGSTGRSTGPHLHFEFRYYGEPFDPNHIVDFQNFRLFNDTLTLCKADFDYLGDARKIVCHSVHRGETLGHIARSYGTTVGALCRLNRITPRTLLKIGRRLIVRAPQNAPKLTQRNNAPPTSVDSTL